MQAGDEFERVGVPNLMAAFGESLAQRLGHVLGIEKRMHGLILWRTARKVSARIADGLSDEGSNPVDQGCIHLSLAGASGGLHQP